MSRFFTLLVCATLCATGCKCADAPKPKTKTSATNALAEKTQPSPRNAPGEDLSDVPVPTEEDYEEKLEKEITEQNLDSELDKLDKEIGEAPPPQQPPQPQQPQQPQQ